MTVELDLPSVLARAAKHATPATIIDVGASDGRWSEIARTIWPRAKILCIEANRHHQAGLDSFCARTGASAVFALAGDHVGNGFFAPSPGDPFGGVGRHVAGAGAIPIPCTTIDAEISGRGLLGPFLIKLDTHGFESAILDGAASALKHSCLLVIEAYTCLLQPGTMRFWELCSRLEGAGFLPTDICEPLHRPLDNRLWQVDLVFESKSSPRVGEARYA